MREQGYLPDIPKRRGIPIEPGEEALYTHDSARFKRRYVIERTNGWLKKFRRLHFRVDRTTASFEALLYLAVIVICARRALG
jgi:transposase